MAVADSVEEDLVVAGWAEADSVAAGSVAAGWAVMVATMAAEVTAGSAAVAAARGRTRWHRRRPAGSARRVGLSRSRRSEHRQSLHSWLCQDWEMGTPSNSRVRNRRAGQQ